MVSLLAIVELGECIVVKESGGVKIKGEGRVMW